MIKMPTSDANSKFFIKVTTHDHHRLDLFCGEQVEITIWAVRGVQGDTFERGSPLAFTGKLH